MYQLIFVGKGLFICKVGISVFGGLELACWPLVRKFSGSNPVEAFGFFRAKKSSARLPRRGSKILSHIADLRHVKEPPNLKAISGLIVPPFAARVAGVIVTCRTPGGASWNVLRFRVVQ
jgi:hypothetical protein